MVKVRKKSTSFKFPNFPLRSKAKSPKRFLIQLFCRALGIALLSLHSIFSLLVLIHIPHISWTSEIRPWEKSCLKSGSTLQSFWRMGRCMEHANIVVTSCRIMLPGWRNTWLRTASPVPSTYGRSLLRRRKKYYPQPRGICTCTSIIILIQTFYAYALNANILTDFPCKISQPTNNVSVLSLVHSASITSSNERQFQGQEKQGTSTGQSVRGFIDVIKKQEQVRLKLTDSYICKITFFPVYDVLNYNKLQLHIHLCRKSWMIFLHEQFSLPVCQFQ